MKNLFKKFKSLTIASLALSLFIGLSLTSCAPSNTEDNTEAAEEQSMEAEEAEHPEGGEHPEGEEHPSDGHEHPADDGEEVSSDSTEADAEHPEGGEHPSED